MTTDPDVRTQIEQALEAECDADNCPNCGYDLDKWVNVHDAKRAVRPIVEREMAKLREERDAMFASIQRILADESDSRDHLLICNYPTGKLGDHFCNCAIGKRIYYAEKQQKQAEAALAAMTQRVDALRERCDLAESSHLLVKAALEKVCQDCAPYLKDGETIAECVVRNREDVKATVVLLSRELQRAERSESALSDLRARVDATVAWLRDMDALDAAEFVPLDERSGYVLRSSVLARLAPTGQQEEDQ